MNIPIDVIKDDQQLILFLAKYTGFEKLKTLKHFKAIRDTDLFSAKQTLDQYWVNPIHESSDDLTVLFLDNAENLGLNWFVGPAHSFGDVEYMLSSDDKDYVIFHQGHDSAWSVINKLEVCDSETTKSPVYKNWYMTITYHA